MAVAYVIFRTVSDDNFEEGYKKEALAIALSPETGWSEVQRRAEMHFKALQAAGHNPRVVFSDENSTEFRDVAVDDDLFFMEEVLLVS